MVSNCLWLSRVLRAISVCAWVILSLAPTEAAHAQARNPAPATAANATKDALSQRLKPETIQELFPGAEQLTPAPGRPLALEVRIGSELKGYIFSTLDVVNATGYAGRAFDLVGGMTPDGKMTGAVLQAHSETIIGRGVPQARLDQFIAGFASATVDSWRNVNPDLLRGASTSGRAMKAGMQSAAERVYSAHIKGEAFQVVTEPMLDRKGYTPFTGDELLAKGSVVRKTITVREVLKMFEDRAGAGSKPTQQMFQITSLDEPFIIFMMALATPASIGNNLFGDTRFRDMTTRQGEGGSTVWMGADGYFSFA